ncbi:unnamed protein product [Chrysoparadoxa australica]
MWGLLLLLFFAPALAAADCRLPIAEVCRASSTEASQLPQAQACSALGGQCGGCAMAGFSTTPMAYGFEDCAACTEGFVLEVVFDDCTGRCVPAESADATLSVKETIASGRCTPFCDDADYSEFLPGGAAEAVCSGLCGEPLCPGLSTQQALQAQTDSQEVACGATGGLCSACQTSGFFLSISPPALDDCATCPPGYEIEPQYDTCSGYCVPTGTASPTVAAAIENDLCIAFCEGGDYSQLVGPDGTCVQGQEITLEERNDSAASATKAVWLTTSVLAMAMTVAVM